MADIMDLKYTRLVIGETLRMYPEPPHLIRRCRTEDVLPQGYTGNVANRTVIRGMDMFLSVYNIHRSPLYWEEPDVFEPERFTMPFANGLDGVRSDEVGGPAVPQRDCSGPRVPPLRRWQQVVSG